MNYRNLGKSGLQVSEIGYGGWGIGQSQWIGADDEESMSSLRRAIELGVNFLDTALTYGSGHSEQLMGRAAREAAETVYVASKIPPKNMVWPAPAGISADEAYPADWVVECTERSLANLGLDAIDVQQFHVWSDDWAQDGSWADGVARLKQEGKIRFFGVSINDHQPANAVELINTGIVDSVQVIYNVFDQSPEDVLLPAAQAKGVGVIVRVPLDEGGLTGRITAGTTFPEGDWRHRYFGGERKQQVVERVEAITKDLGIPEAKLPEVALRFCLSHPAVSTVIPGMRSVRNVDANTAAAERGPLSEQELSVLHQHRWVRNFYNAP